MPSSKPKRNACLARSLILWIILYLKLSPSSRLEIVHRHPAQFHRAIHSFRLINLKLLYAASCVLTGSAIYQVLPPHPLAPILAIGVTGIITIFTISIIQLSLFLSDRFPFPIGKGQG